MAFIKASIKNPTLLLEDEKILNNPQNYSVNDIIMSIEKLSKGVVEEHGYIAITRTTSFITAEGNIENVFYTTYLTFLPSFKENDNIIYYELDEEILRFKDNHDSSIYHMDFYGEEDALKKITYLLTQHFLLRDEVLSEEVKIELEQYKNNVFSKDYTLVYKK